MEALGALYVSWFSLTLLDLGFVKFTFEARIEFRKSASKPSRKCIRDSQPMMGCSTGLDSCVPVLRQFRVNRLFRNWVAELLGFLQGSLRTHLERVEKTMASITELFFDRNFSLPIMAVPYSGSILIRRLKDSTKIPSPKSILITLIVFSTPTGHVGNYLDTQIWSQHSHFETNLSTGQDLVTKNRIESDISAGIDR